MNQSNPPERDEALSRALREWTVDASLPPRFRENVWSRIEKTQTSSGLGLWTALTHWVERVLSQPKVGLSFVAALLLLGAVAGFWRANIGNDRADARMSSRYVQSVDPYRAVALNQ